jgi:hypothetical protein
MPNVPTCPYLLGETLLTAGDRASLMGGNPLDKAHKGDERYRLIVTGHKSLGWDSEELGDPTIVIERMSGTARLGEPIWVDAGTLPAPLAMALLWRVMGGAQFARNGWITSEQAVARGM